MLLLQVAAASISQTMVAVKVTPDPPPPWGTLLAILLAAWYPRPPSLNVPGLAFHKPQVLLREPCAQKGLTSSEGCKGLQPVCLRGSFE